MRMKRSKIMMCDGGVGSRCGLAPIGMDSRAGDCMAVKRGRGINTAIGRLSCLPLSPPPRPRRPLQSGDSANAPAMMTNLARISQADRTGWTAGRQGIRPGSLDKVRRSCRRFRLPFQPNVPGLLLIRHDGRCEWSIVSGDDARLQHFASP